MSKLNVNKIGPHTKKDVTIESDVVISGSTTVTGPLIVKGDFIISGDTKFNDINTITDVFSNNKNITNNIVLKGDINSFIVGPESTINPNKELIVDGDVNLLIFGPEDFSDKQIETDVVSYGKDIDENITLDNSTTNSTIFGDEIDIIKDNELVVENDLVIFGPEDFSDKEIITNVISNPKIITDDIKLDEGNNSVIFGDEIEISEGSEIEIFEGSDLLIFDPEDFIFDGNSTSSGSPITNLYVENLNVENVDVTNVVTENIISNNYYGNGSGLTNVNTDLPLKKSEGENSFKQIGNSNLTNLGKNSSTLGDFNSANGDYSNIVGSSNITGAKQHEFFKIPDTNYLLVLGNGSHSSFGIGNPGQIQLSATCTGSTIVSTLRTTVKSSRPYINDCYRYTIVNNQTIIPITISYTDCETNTLKTTSNFKKGLCSKTVPTYTISPQYSGYTDIIESGVTITLIGKCCENIITTTATTYTTKRITTTATTTSNIPLAFSGCVKYNVRSNSRSGGYLNYTSCSGSARTEYFPYVPISNTSNYNICSSTVPTWSGPSSLFTVTPVSNCCSYYTIRNYSPNTYVWSVTDCFTGVITNVTINSGKLYGSCSAFPPNNIPQDLWSEATGGEFCRTNRKIICTAYTVNEKTTVITTACSISNLVLTGGCVTYRFANNNQIVTSADDNVFWTDCDGIARSFKLNVYTPGSCSNSFIDVCAIKDSAYAILGITITQIYSGCCIDDLSYVDVNVLYNFSGATIDGDEPWSNLFLENGILYGTTSHGGIYDEGAIFSYEISTGNLQILHSFDQQWFINNRPQDGFGPVMGGFFKASNGKLYANSAFYRTANNSFVGGSIYSYDIGTNQYTFLNFYDSVSGLYHGQQHDAALMEPSVDIGVLYGISTNHISVSNACVIYKYDIGTNSIVELLDLGTLPASMRGGISITQMFELSPGVLYGTSYVGGQNNRGVIFKYEIFTNTYTVVHNFDGITGANPFFSKWAEKNGVLYGVTVHGGQYNRGVIFSYDIINGYTKLYDVCPNDVANGLHTVMMGSDGKLYITGNNNFGLHGIIVSFDINAKFLRTLHTFNSLTESSTPFITLVETNNKFYGAARVGGRLGYNLPGDVGNGTLFEFNKPSSCTSGTTSIHSNIENVDNGINTIIDTYNYNATASDGTNKSYFDVLSFTKGITDQYGVISNLNLNTINNLNTVNNLYDLPQNTEYVLLEINPDVPSIIDAGFIVSNFYGNSASAEGIGTQSKGNASHSEGFGTLANADFSHAEGYGTQTKGIGSHAEGHETTSTGNYSHSEGFQNESGSGFLLSTFDGVNTFTIENKNLTYPFIESDLYLIDSENNYGGKFTILSVEYNNVDTIITIDTNSNTGIILVTSGDTYIRPNAWCNEDKTFIRCYLGPYMRPNRHAWPNGKNVFTILDLTIDGIHYGSGNTLTVNVPQDLTVGIGTDGNAYVTNITDWVNSLLPDGFTFWNDMTVLDRPINSTFNLVIDYTEDPEILIVNSQYQYYYTDLGGGIGSFKNPPFIQPNSICSAYTCTNISNELVYFGDYSHTEGLYNKVFNVGSHAEGFGNQIYGEYSHAEGYQNIVLGSGSHAEGLGTIALGDYQHVSGKYNTSGNATSLFVVGNGTSNTNRSNVLEVNPNNIKIYEVLNIVNVQEYPNNFTAILSGLTTGDVYRTGEYLKIVY